MKNFILFILLVFLSWTCNFKKQAIQKSDKPVPSFCGPKVTDLDTEPGFDGKLAPLFEGLDVLDYPITTQSELCQKYFNQGLVLAYGFNHAEAARSFKEAANQDPNCAMCYWGIAWVLGPNYNAPSLSEQFLPRIQDALMNAKLRMSNCSQKEKDLIGALDKRYPKSIEEDNPSFYVDFANAMKEVHQKYPEDLDIAVITAESLMNLHPWDMWNPETGEARDWTPEIVKIIEKVLEKNPNHPQAIHLYIHGLEASPYPEKVIPFADKLRDAVPGSGHLVHMPSHTYINTGYYHKGSVANEKAVKIDSMYVAGCHEAGIYPLGYYPHNWHFLSACAALEGRGNRALEASEYMADYVVNHEMMFDPGGESMQHFYSIPWYIMVKFAKWDEILEEEKPDEKLVYPNIIWHYARGMAYAAKKDLLKAENELASVKLLEKDSSLEGKKFFGINYLTDLIFIAKNTLEGEIAFRNQDYDKSIKLLKAAISKEDSLAYNEPPDWFFSVRHLLGNVLLEAGRYAEAEEVYRQDLKKLKENGWALMGLYQSLLKQGKEFETEKILQRYQKAFEFSEIELTSSVI
jgi:tetratricopeptide (TPR) repeat protein